jgi:uncharacterized damage-inducible protein DinB/predicted RNase H-like HicB family nuclease
MIRYPVYLEVGDDGRCMIHVLDQPGCFVRGFTRSEALVRLPEALQDYQAWLRHRGEPAAEPGERIDYEIVEEVSGTGGFNPGDKVALFSPETRPILNEDMEPFFHRMRLTRIHLLDLTSDLPDFLYTWKPEPDTFSISEVLRHVGRAEEWYVSRLLAEEELPAEWCETEDMPVFDYLDMVRQTALHILRHLTKEQRSKVFYPAYQARHPDEGWTARKVLRRFLEHEREHIGQVRQVQAAWCARHRPKEFDEPAWGLKEFY